MRPLKHGDMYLQKLGSEQYLWLVISNKEYILLHSTDNFNTYAGKVFTNGSASTWATHEFVGNISDILGERNGKTA